MQCVARTFHGGWDVARRFRMQREYKAQPKKLRMMIVINATVCTSIRHSRCSVWFSECWTWHLAHKYKYIQQRRWTSNTSTLVFVFVSASFFLPPFVTFCSYYLSLPQSTSPWHCQCYRIEVALTTKHGRNSSVLIRETRKNGLYFPKRPQQKRVAFVESNVRHAAFSE